MDTAFETDWDSFLLTPLVSFQVVRCENTRCGEAHGVSVSIGWFFFTAYFYFPTPYH